MDAELYGVMPIKPYLLKFVQYKERLEKDDFLNVSTSGNLGYVLMLCCGTPNALEKESTMSYFGMDIQYTAKLKFRLTTEMQSFDCYHFTRQSIVQYNAYLHREFTEFLLMHTELGQQQFPPVSIKTTILKWLEILDLEYDIEYDSLKRAHLRYRKAKGTRFIPDHVIPLTLFN